MYHDYGDIFMYDLSTNMETQIAGPGFQLYPAIYGDRIVWQGLTGLGNFDIYMYDLSTSTETQITTNTAKQTLPAIYGDRIVWEDDRNGIFNPDIYMYDLSTSTETQITTNTAKQENPAIYGNRIVWRDYRNGNDDIYMYDLSMSTETQITTNTANQRFPAIYGDRIVWEDDRNVNRDIYAVVYIEEDSDGDGLTDIEELAGWDITIYDCFGNSIGSFHVTSDPLQSDEDGDGLNDLEEKNGWNVRYQIKNPDPPPEKVWIAYLTSSNPREADWDNDGLNDWEEGVHKTDPNRANTDCDGAWNTNDGFEVEYGLDPLIYDTGGNGIKDGLEIDLWIEAAGYDPSNPELVPPEILLWAVSQTNNPVIPTFIDIEPGTLNLKSNGEYITCYIELPEGYSVANIILSKILLNEIVSAELEPTAVNDYDLDSIPDLMVKFCRAEVMGLIGETNDYDEGVKFYDVQLTITGKLTDETLFEGKDTVKVIIK